jgi:hypothetical protein
MKTHFGEDFRLLIPGDFAALRRVCREDNLWRAWPQVVCTLDSVKPLDARRGWTRQQVEQYNHERVEDLVSAGWDLVIVDEAHRLGGQVVFQTLQQDHQAALNRDRRRGEQAFAARQVAVERIGLPAVRMHRLTLLDEERQVWRETLVRDEETLPELVPLLILRVEAEAANG